MKIDFMVVGAQKSGTTSLHELFCKVPLFSLPKIKETHYFSHDDRFIKGNEWYQQQYAKKSTSIIHGEVDPEYLYFPSTPSRISHFSPECKIIAIFRDPCKRAYSHYLMSVRRGLEKCTFAESIALEEKRKSQLDELTYRKHFSYIDRGFYAEQVERYLEYFDLSNIYFMKFEEFISNDMREMAISGMFDFLGLDRGSYVIPEAVKSNTAKSSKYKFVNELIWNKDSGAYFKKVANIFTSESQRTKIAKALYSYNSAPPENQVKDYSLKMFPDDIIFKLNQDVDKLSEITGLHFDDWEINRNT